MRFFSLWFSVNCESNNGKSAGIFLPPQYRYTRFTVGRICRQGNNYVMSHMPPIMFSKSKEGKTERRKRGKKKVERERREEIMQLNKFKYF